MGRLAHVRSASRLSPLAISCALATMLPFAGAEAARLNYDLSLRYMHSDNITLDAVDGQGEDIFSPQVRFDFTHDSSRVNATLRGDLQYLHYLDGTYDDDARGEFTGNLDWTLLPERITFSARDSLSEQSVSSFAAFNPGNQQKINIFEAGPSFHARFSDATRAQVDLRYTNSWAEETETFNGDRYNVAARLLRLLRDTDALIFNLEASQTKYDTISDLYDYKRYDGYVTYRSALSKIDLSIDAGYSRLKPEGVEDSSSALFRGYMEWRVTSRSRLSTSVAHQFSDAAQDLIQRVGAPGGEIVDPDPPTGPVIGEPGDPGLQIVPDTFKQRRVSFGYEYTGDRLSVLVDPGHAQLRYIRGSTFDTDNLSLRVTARYRLDHRTTVVAMAQRYEREFINAERDDRDMIVGAGLAMRFSPHWGAQFDYRRRDRDSTTSSQNYVENILLLSITYFR